MCYSNFHVDEKNTSIKKASHYKEAATEALIFNFYLQANGFVKVASIHSI